MSELHINSISKNFGNATALRDISLHLPAGKLICFLGPSGCGKTTLLRIIAGLEQASSGKVMWQGDELSAIPAHKRNIGMVFQSFALFPHLNVEQNIAYGLKIRGVDKKTRLQKAQELLELVQLPHVGKRHIAQLSGGQRQRIAMARALALEPSLFLLDEPLSALDAKLREAMQVELKLLQQRLGITTIVVTHDQQEAMTMADIIVVMGKNKVQQVGTPLEIYHQPVNRFVADFIGSNNFLPARVTDTGQVDVLGQPLELAHLNLAEMPAVDSTFTLSIRPEKLRLSLEKPEGWSVPVSIQFIRDLGSSVETFVEVEEQQLIVKGSQHFNHKDKLWLSFTPEDAVVLRA